MDPIIYTKRLKLTLMTSAERGSPELEWLHEIRSDAQSTLWSIVGRAKSIEDTEKFSQRCLPQKPEDQEEGDPKSYRVVYAVHEILQPSPDSTDPDTAEKPPPSRFIGIVNIRSLGPKDLQLADNFAPLSVLSPSVLFTELGYQFMPRAWGKGFATESVDAVLSALLRGASFWQPYEKVYMRALVNEENPASLGVMRKLGLQGFGIWEYRGEPLFLGGKWSSVSRVYIFGRYLIE